MNYALVEVAVTRSSKLVAFLILLILLGCGGAGSAPHPPQQPAAPTTLVELLKVLPGAVVKDEPTLAGFKACYRVDLTQPVDHSRPNGPTYTQKFYISHRDEAAPTVFATTGYDVSQNYQSEPARILKGNQILLVHRYFTDAMPVPTDWTYCTTAQMAADQHRIRELFRSVYRGKWVTTGASKGGMTALYYRYYFPADVDATVAYVAPIMEQPDDPRFVPFLQSVGTTDDQARIRAFQREILKRRATILPLLEAYARDTGMSFKLINPAAALEYAVLDAPFGIWQYGTPQSAASLPPVTATDQELYSALEQVSPTSYYSDEDFLLYQTLFYQAYTELGYCPYWTAPVADLLSAVKNPSYRDFAPRGIPTTFRPEVMKAVVPWLKNQGRQILYIYGGIDPWTAAAVQPATGLDALSITEPGLNHGASIRRLKDPKPALDALSRWLGTTVTLPVVAPGMEAAAQDEAPPRRRRL